MLFRSDAARPDQAARMVEVIVVSVDHRLPHGGAADRAIAIQLAQPQIVHVLVVADQSGWHRVKGFLRPVHMRQGLLTLRHWPRPSRPPFAQQRILHIPQLRHIIKQHKMYILCGKILRKLRQNGRLMFIVFLLVPALGENHHIARL